MEAVPHISRTNSRGASSALAGSHTEMVARETERPIRTALWLMLCVLCAVSFFEQVYAHEIPTDVVIQSYLKPDGDEMKLLVRVPLESDA